VRYGAGEEAWRRKGSGSPENRTAGSVRSSPRGSRGRQGRALSLGRVAAVA